MTAWSFSQSTVRTDTTSSQRDSAEVPPKRTKIMHYICVAGLQSQFTAQTFKVGRSF